MLYNVISSTCDHITVALTVNAASQMVPPRCIIRGIRNVAAAHLASLPSNGRSGAWGISSAPKGYVTADIFVLLLQDLVSFLEKNQIPCPIILFMDRASPHISLAMAEYCKVQDIQPWLFKPNTTHITQPLDLTFMKSLKDVLKKKVTQWQQATQHPLQSILWFPLSTAQLRSF